MEFTQSQKLQDAIQAMLVRYNARDFARAEQLARALTVSHPHEILPWKVLGAVLKLTEQLEAALVPMQHAVALNGNDAEAHNNLGIVLKDLGRLSEAEDSYHQAIVLNPGMAEAHNNLGNVLMTHANFQSAAECFKEAIRLKPAFADAHYGLGNVLQRSGQLTAAEKCYRAAIQIKPNYAEAFVNLGATLRDQGRLQEAEAMSHEALRLRPDLARAQSNLGNVLKDLGRLLGAVACYREAIRLKPDDTNAYSNLLFSLNYVEALSAEAALHEAKHYGASVSARALPKFSAWATNPDPRKLKVGFVSGDLRNHPVGYFMEGLIKRLDSDQFELYAFPTHHREDALTQRVKPYFREWVPIFALSDADAAEAIHERGIQVLIDLSGHTAHNRLPVFAYKPAPVQASYLGYFATTGLLEMDFFIGDPTMAPAAERQHFAEKTYPLAESWLCLTPPGALVPIEPLPALNNGYVTFGCFGNLGKMNDAVVKLWARLLQQVPTAKLCLKAKQLAEPNVVASVQARFAVCGVSSERLILEGSVSRDAYYEAYNGVDVVLDTFPYPGGTTSVDALWMGVPVLTLKGDRFLSHLGESIAINAGQDDWIAQDQDDYVRKAVAFVADLERLADVRSRLRARVQESPLMDAERFARNFGAALWDLWAIAGNQRQ